ncbi:MAG: restriction endonuclease subunit S, partial [Clostridia bacterium]|nr:restriction endonuclease subunit S [Clostridia bacterium]
MKESNHLTVKELNEVCLEIVDCVNKTAPVSDEPTPYKMIRTTNIKDGCVNLTDVNYVTEKVFEKWTRRVLPKINDVILTREAPLGEVGLLRSDEKVFLGQRTMIYRANEQLLNQRFLYYSFLGSFMQSQIKELGSGSTVEHLRVPQAEKLKIILPRIEAQRKTAAVLSAYDDLIETNKCRIAILEKMADEIYREWFVRLRFPGYERTKVVRGVPSSWDIMHMGNLISSYIGGGWGEDIQSVEFSKPAYVIRGTDIPNLSNGEYSKKILRYHKESNFNSRKLFVDDIIFEVSGGSVGQLLGRTLHITKRLVEFFENNVICASFCKLLRPDKQKISSLFLKYFLKLYYETGLVGTFQTQSTGISNYHFEDFIKYQTLIVPTRDILNAFDDIVGNLMAEKDILALKNNSLKNTRDLFLSRLLSGKLSVEDLDIHFPKSMEDDYAEL